MDYWIFSNHCLIFSELFQAFLSKWYILLINYIGLSYFQDIFGISTMSLLVFRIPIIILATLYGFLGRYETLYYYGYDLPTDFLYYLATNIFVSNICLHLGISDICGLSLSNPYLFWLINSLIIRFWIFIYSRLSFCLLGIHISRTLLFVAWGFSIGLLAAWAFLWPTKRLIYLGLDLLRDLYIGILYLEPQR